MARLRAEHGVSARAGAVGLELAVFEDVAQQVEQRNADSLNADC